MEKKFYIFIAIVMLAALMPVPSIAAPEVARTSSLTVGSWNLDDGLGIVSIQFAAEDVNWQVTKAAELEFGYIYCDPADCSETVDISLAITKRTYAYPQNLDLEANVARTITPNTACSIEQFVRILDSGGVVKKEATNGPFNYCISVPYP